MAEANPKVMEMIEGEIKENPDISNPELFEKAKAMDKGVSKLSPRQFNAMYPLQVKRAMKPSRPKRKRSTRRSGRRADGKREDVREVLLSLARDVANAQGKGDVVDVVAGIDGYVDRVLKAAG
ncbi:MAG: hypothetical protein ACN0LA_10380 [Candidatus Longimicrobiales bacterium M2_2A_002]